MKDDFEAVVDKVSRCTVSDWRSEYGSWPAAVRAVLVEADRVSSLEPTYVTVTFEDLPMFKDLFTAVHTLLVLRLLGKLDGRDGLEGWNALITAHDAIVAEADRCGQ